MFARFVMALWCGLLASGFASLLLHRKDLEGPGVLWLAVALVPLGLLTLLGIVSGLAAWRRFREDWAMLALLSAMTNTGISRAVLMLVDPLMLGMAALLFAVMGGFWLYLLVTLGPPLANGLMDRLAVALFL